VRFAGFPHDENPVSRDVSAYTINSSKGALTAVGNFAAGLQSLAVAIAAPSPAVQIQNLITSTLITNLASNVQSQLDAKLNAAIRTLDAANNNSSSVAANQLQAFVNAVSADVQSGKITCTQATALVNAAQAIVAGLGQPPLIISLPC
jgi:low affinity Fe/Cu permease